MGNKIARHRQTVDDRYTRPQGLYQHKDVDHRKLRRLILDAKLAPCYLGADDLATDLEECPICFLFYPSLNRSKCCTKGICTECFLQLKSPHTARTTQCPFCKYPNYAVEYRGAKTLEEKGVEQAEEQKVIEAKIRMRQKELQDEKERKMRKEDDIQEGRIFPPSELLRNNFTNLHGFTLPLSDEVDTGFRAGGIAQGLSDRQPQVDQLARSVVEENSNSTFVESQQSSLQSSSAILSVPERNSSRTQLLLGSADGNSLLGQAARVQGSFMRFNRDEEFDLDLEDIMVMEAVWRSIQEPGSQQLSMPTVQGNVGLAHSSLEDDRNAAHPPALATGDMREVVIRSSVTGGLAGAIAALAERQVLSVDNSVSQQIHQSHQVGSEIDESTANMGSDSTGNMNGVCRVLHDLQEEGDFGEGVSAHGTPARSNGTQLYRDADLERVHRGSIDRKSEVEDEERAQSTWMDSRDNITHDSQSVDRSLNNWIEVSLENGRVLSPHISEDSRGSISDWMLDHSSEAVEVGTSFSSSVPSASELPWEAPDVPLIQNAEGAVDSEGFTVSSAMVPESFEEQMMLAMALSLAEAQARFR